MPTVQLDDDALARLDELRHSIHRKAGIDISRRTLLNELILAACTSETGVVDVSLGPADDEAVAEWLDARFSSGVETTEEDIDEILYGQEPFEDDDDQSSEHNP